MVHPTGGLPRLLLQFLYRVIGAQGELEMASKRLALALATILVGWTTVAPAQNAGSSAAPHVAPSRAGAALENGSELNGTTEWILVAISLAVLIFGIIEFTSDQENSNSP